jgi:hypothetical protein
MDKSDKKLAKNLAKAAKKQAAAAAKPGKPDDLAERSTQAAEKNARLRVWQLIVAAIAAIAVIMGVVWQILG